ncbi:DUF1616 domain-containing protein [Halapricum desulfuricans]|uniref:Membrane associated protein with extracellular Ig-like domain, a component of a putative secretion system n=1 Tax=Halapricum desulfuricans TaxID=2841257 RepID=A0A897N2B8_9EURY|nr:DUF1616 domain-containing protein [Halapricum desulfuricans]QSG07092.1 Membrane associated protein with extracellular Ig-like domain, a component of a putative secretion system [Halapricum desulfuricans]
MDDTQTPLAGRALLVGLTVALLVGTAAGVYTLGTADRSGEYTEFYVLGPGGEAGGYPTELFVNETATVEVGVVNHFDAERTYTVTLELDNRTEVTRSIRLGPDREWRERLSFAPSSPGSKQVRISLYEGRTASDTPDDVLQFTTRVSAR